MGTRDLPLVVFDCDDEEAAGNCRLMAHADALLMMVRELSGTLHGYATDCDDDASEKLVQQARKLIRAATKPGKGNV